MPLHQVHTVDGKPFVQHIEIPMPEIGSKAWLLESKGIFVLERGPGMLRTIAFTHTGSGRIDAYDGVPDPETGRFPQEDLPLGDPDYATANGRCIYRCNNMGSWMMDGGFRHGLTIFAIGGTESVCAIATIVWLPVRPRRA